MLLDEIRNGDDRARNVLLERYKKFAWKLANESKDIYQNLSFSVEDYMSVAYEATLVAMERYTSGPNSFYSYWRLIAINKISKFVRSHRKLAVLDVATIRIDESFNFDNIKVHDSSFSDTYFKEENLTSSILNTMRHSNQFSYQEYRIVSLFLEGYEFKEIAKEMRKSRSTVYYLFQNAVSKLRRLMK